MEGPPGIYVKCGGASVYFIKLVTKSLCLQCVMHSAIFILSKYIGMFSSDYLSLTSPYRFFLRDPCHPGLKEP